MNEVQLAPRCPVCNGQFCFRNYDNIYGEIVCTKLKDIILNKVPMMEMKINMLERDNFELKTRALTPGDIKELINYTLRENPSVDAYYTSMLKKFIDNPSLRLETVYAVFQEMIEDRYPLLRMSFGEILPTIPSPRIQYIKEHMTDNEEHKLIEYAQRYKYVGQTPYRLYALFKLERPKLSNAVEDILHDIIQERHKQGRSAIELTSGSWSIYRILEEYKEANLGKAVLTIKKCFNQDQYNSEIIELVKKYPEAERYVTLI